MRKRNQHSVYVQVTDEEWERYKKCLEMDKMNSIEWLTLTVRKYIEESEAHYKSLMP